MGTMECSRCEGFQMQCMTFLNCCTGGNALSAIFPELHLGVGAKTLWLPDDTKTGGEDGPMEVSVLDSPLCSVAQLLECLTTYAAQNQPITNFLTRVLNPERTGFVEKAMSSNDIGARAKNHLQSAGLYEGHTVHGTRRGSMQHAVQNGMSVEDVSRKAQIKTPAIANLYLNPFGHLGQ